MKYLGKSLYIQVIFAIVGGIIIGRFFPHFAISLKPLGDVFIKLVKMMIGPVVFCTILSGITSMQDMNKVGRVGAKALIYFEILTTVALLLGLLVVNLIGPGKGMNINPSTLDPSQVQGYIKPDVIPGGVVGFLVHIIPENIIDALARNELLQVLFFSVLLGFGLSRIGKRADPILKGIRSLSEGLFAVIGIIMKVAPLGAFGAMAFTIGQYGFGSLARLGELMIAFYITCLFFIFVILGGILRLYGFNLWKLLVYIK
ncbi:MAG: hypothetical protein NVS1B13_20210 [Flavisolibacter sp.]